MLAGQSEEGIPGYVLRADLLAASSAASSSQTITARERVSNFNVNASPLAQQLAGLLAAAPIITMPVVRLIQDTMLDKSTQLQVAEVFLGGLLKPLVKITLETDPEQVQYEFIEGVRSELLNSIPVPDREKVFDLVSRYVAKRLGKTLREFVAWLRDPSQIEDEEQAATVKPFAKVAEEILQQLGYQFASKETGASEGEANFAINMNYDVMLQGFHWNSPDVSGPSWYNIIKENAQRIKNSGFTLVWFPPPSDSVDKHGYEPRELNKLDNAYGSETELKAAINALKPVKAIADIVINRDLDHDNPETQNGIITWMNSLKDPTRAGFVGWIYDFVKGYAGCWAVELYNQKTNPEFSVGGFFDYGPQKVIDWIDSTHPNPALRSAAFDFLLRNALHQAIAWKNFHFLKYGDRAAGLIGLYPDKAVTFLENHDTEEARGGAYVPSFPGGDQMVQGYAYLLTHPGIPCVFWRDIYDSGSFYEEQINKLIEIRKQYRIHSKSKLYIATAQKRLVYAAYIQGDKGEVAMKIGPGNWQPSGSKWQPDRDLLISGQDYVVWGEKGKFWDRNLYQQSTIPNLKTILLVEDQPKVIEQISELLSSQYGIAVRGIEDVSEVINLAQSGVIDLILINYQLLNSRYQGERVNGIDIIYLLRDNPSVSQYLPIIGFSVEVYREREFLQYADGFYDKNKVLNEGAEQDFINYLRKIFNRVKLLELLPYESAEDLDSVLDLIGKRHSEGRDTSEENVSSLWNKPKGDVGTFYLLENLCLLDVLVMTDSGQGHGTIRYDLSSSYLNQNSSRPYSLPDGDKFDEKFQQLPLGQEELLDFIKPRSKLKQDTSLSDAAVRHPQEGDVATYRRLENLRLLGFLSITEVGTSRETLRYNLSPEYQKYLSGKTST